MSTRVELHELPRLPKRREDAHKGEFGHVLVVGGSRVFIGAPCLAAMGALRSGAGLVTVACPESQQPILATKLTEAMTLALPEGAPGSIGRAAWEPLREFAVQADVIAVGPGLGTHEETKALVQRLARDLDHPMVIDADGLNAFAGQLAALSRRRSPTALTPHPGEMGRLAGCTAADVQLAREEKALEVAMRAPRLVVALKGAGSIVTDGERVFVSATGNPGMATGGTGDVLTGVVAALLGQGFDVFSATAIAVHVHGAAGDAAARRTGQMGLIASDLADALPAAIEAYRGGGKRRTSRRASSRLMRRATESESESPDA